MIDEGATMGNGIGKQIYFSPWLDRETGATYGPKSHATLAKHHAKHRDWSYRVSKPSKAAQSVEAAVLRDWMRLEDGTLRIGIAEGEAQAYILVCERGMSERSAARKLNVSRRTVRVRLARLMERAARE